MSAPPRGTSLSVTEPSSWLIAHRGDQAEAQENSLPAFMAAAAAGARFIECDIQFGRDLQPLVFHDHHLGRLFGRPDLHLAMHPGTALGGIMPGLEAFAPLPLAELLGWLDGELQLTLFLEIKPNVLSRHRPGVIVRLLSPLLNRPSAERIVIISQSAAMLESCARHLPQRRGWVASLRRRPRCALHSVFLDKRQTGSLPDWKAEGVRVAVYTVNDAAEAQQHFVAGADLVETNYYARLCHDLENSRF